MKKATLLFLVFINSFAIYSQQKEIIFEPNRTLSQKMAAYTGKVVNILDDKPIDNVKVIVENIGVVAVTSKNGTFKFTAPDNIAEIAIEKEGNISMSQVFVTGKENKNNILFKMIPENLDGRQLEIFNQKYPTSDNSKNIDEHNEDSHNATQRAIKTSVPNTIRVLMPSGSVVTMSMDEYLKGVVPREVSPSWHANALKAQAVVARSYATVTFKHQSQGADVCTTTHCQAWSSTHYPSTSLAVTQTSKFSIKHNGNIIEALFFGNCNGVKTKNNESVWGGSAVPYLRSKSCGCGFSSYFGHGVGMCQQGDRKFANEGMSWENIIKHYYTGVTIDKPNTTPDPVNNIPVLNTPAAGASVPSPVNMTWSTSVSGAACRIQVSKVNTGWTAANGFTTETAATANVPVNYSTPGLLNYTWPNEFTAPANRPVAGSTYYWTVRSYSAATGTSSYSPVRSFRISTSTASERLMDNAGFTVYSDAARKEISINFSAAAQKATISLFDISGNQIFEKSHAVQKGANSLKESVAGLKEGVYILMLNDGEKVSTQNIIIQ